MLEVLKAEYKTAEEGNSCTDIFRLRDLERGKRDKLGNTVKEILWLGANYAIYRSNSGIYVHFSDCPEEEREQMEKFTKICPELCELRYLTTQIRGRNWLPWPLGDRSHTLYEHNMAQALMLMMENQAEEAKDIARQALAMAVRRVTNDNTIRYVRACFFSASGCIAIAVLALWLFNAPNSNAPDLMSWKPYLVGGMFGAVGAAFSIVTRLQAFELKPCNDSYMNKWMSAIRVVIGVMSAIALLLFMDTLLGDALRNLVGSDKGKRFAELALDTKGLVVWQTVAVFGFIGGFAERLIPNMLRQTVDKMESAVGTPVQAVRSKEMVKPDQEASARYQR